MRYEDVIHFFGNREAAAAGLQVSQSALSQWKKAGKIPKLRALEMELKSNRRLRYDPAAYSPHAGAQ